MALVKSVLVTTGNGIILPARPKIRYRVLDFCLYIVGACKVCLFFGGKPDDANADVFFMDTADVGGSRIVCPSSYVQPTGTLYEGNYLESVSIATDPDITPHAYSFLRYEEVP